MLKECVDYCETARKAKIDPKIMTLYDNLKPLQDKIKEKEGKLYSLGELADTVRYCNRWTK